MNAGLILLWSGPDPSTVQPAAQDDLGGQGGTGAGTGASAQREPGHDSTDAAGPTGNDATSVTSAGGGAPTLAELYASHGLQVPGGPAQRAGCPPPPATGGNGGGGGGWTPPVTVPEADLPAPAPASTWSPASDPSAGKGMWIWQYGKTESSDYDAIVAQAVAAELDHVWLRVGDSRDGFYAQRHLDVLVPAFHAAGIDVIGWGFPFLHDPMGDVAWSLAAVEWRSPEGDGLDGFSPDIETSTEGVKLTADRVEVYLSHLRAAVGELPILATVYPPVDWVWESDYPYERMVDHIDTFVPMDYWSCGEPGYMVRQSLQRLSDLRPVHVIGQAFANCCAGRREDPSAEETLRFFDVAVREGAVGASLWVWQDITSQAWDAMARYPWHAATRSHAAWPTTPDYAAD